MPWKIDQEQDEVREAYLIKHRAEALGEVCYSAGFVQYVLATPWGAMTYNWV